MKVILKNSMEKIKLTDFGMYMYFCKKEGEENVFIYNSDGGKMIGKLPELRVKYTYTLISKEEFLSNNNNRGYLFKDDNSKESFVVYNDDYFNAFSTCYIMINSIDLASKTLRFDKDLIEIIEQYGDKVVNMSSIRITEIPDQCNIDNMYISWNDPYYGEVLINPRKIYGKRDDK